jgi:hypothetical protein
MRGIHTSQPIWPLVRGVVSSSGGGWEHIVVDRDTDTYIDGRVVIVPEPIWEAIDKNPPVTIETGPSFPPTADWNTMPDTDQQISADEHRKMLTTAIYEMQNHAMFDGDAIVAVLGHIRATLPERYNTEPPITPGIQRVLDCAVVYVRQFVGSPNVSNPIVRDLIYAVDNYQAVTMPAATPPAVPALIFHVDTDNYVYEEAVAAITRVLGYLHADSLRGGILIVPTIKEQ